MLKSNLDRLPPNSLLAKKRKAEAAAQEGPRPKRGRTQSSKESSKTPGPDTTPRMSTRRTTRQDAAKTTTSPEPSVPDHAGATEALQAPILVGKDHATAGSLTSPQQLEHSQRETTEQRQVPVSVGINQTTSRKPTLLQPLMPDQTETTEDIQVPVASPTKSSSSDGSSLDEDMNTVASLLRGDDKVSGPVPGKVEYFARVHTKKGHIDVAVTSEDLTDNVEIIQKYAVWVQQESAPINYHDFKSNFGYTKV